MKRNMALWILAISLFVGSTPAMASDRVGIYGVVERIVFEPNETSPERVQVWGAFAIADRQSKDFYQKPQRGYLYMNLQPGKESQIRREWADLKSVAGTNQVVSFGMRYDVNVRLRNTDEKAGSPDQYPVGFGVTKVNRQSDLFNELRALVKRTK